MGLKFQKKTNDVFYEWPKSISHIRKKRHRILNTPPYLFHFPCPSPYRPNYRILPPFFSSKGAGVEKQKKVKGNKTLFSKIFNVQLKQFDEFVFMIRKWKLLSHWLIQAKCLFKKGMLLFLKCFKLILVEILVFLNKDRKWDLKCDFKYCLKSFAKVFAR